MGAFVFGLDRRLVEALQSALPLSTFVETGTFHGDTVALVRSAFRMVWSVEMSPEYCHKAQERFGDSSNVKILHGDSAEELAKLTPELRNESTLFFLDAHWCEAENVAGAGQSCPLLDELQAIGCLNRSSVIVIDDARLFLTACEPRDGKREWPGLEEIVNALRALSRDHELVVVNDCIVFYPVAIRQAVRSFIQNHSIDVLDVVTEARSAASELETLSRICEDRASALRQLEREVRRLEGERDERRRLDRQVEKERDALNAQLAGLSKQLEDKERVIKVLASVVGPYQRLGVVAGTAKRVIWHCSNTVRLLMPKLGKLELHPPVPLRLPEDDLPRTGAHRWPSICIVTPALNQAEFIERTVLSVLEQDYEEVEYVVQDGGSVDGTKEVLERYKDRLASLESASDAGQANAINIGFEKTTSDVMCWLNSDDMLLPGALAYVGEYFSRNPEVDVVYGHRVLIDRNDGEIGRWVLPPHDDAVLSWADFVPQETLFWRRRIWEEVGGYIDERYTFAMDWDLLLRFRDAGANMARLPRFLGAFRVHENQKTRAEIETAGLEEMGWLRERATGLSTVTHSDVKRAIAPYLARHVVHDIAWRARSRLKRLDGMRRGV